MLPTIERRRARSTYSSVRRLPSCTASRVSVTPTLTTIRFFTAVLIRGPAPRQLSLLEPPHSHREQEAQSHERDDHGRSAVAHERKRDADHREQPRHHAQVDERLGGEEHGHPEGDEPPSRLARGGGDLEATEDEE